MRINLVSGAVIRCLLAAFTAAGISSAGSAQEFPTPAGDREVWSSGDAGAPVIGPSLSDDYLAPIPAEEGAVGAASGEPCSTCQDGEAGGVRAFYNRCGCDTQLFPWFTGPGSCDNWCVGPHWNVEVDGMFIRRDNAEWDQVAGITDVVDQFDYGPGVRLFATGYNESNYGLQIGYEGVNDFHSTAVTATDEVTYESTINSLEVNVMRRRESPIRFFAGGRYIEIDEDYIETTVATGDTAGTFVANRLMGVQVGILRDAWQLNRWVSIEPFGNVGAYFNDFKREDVDFVGAVQTVDKNEFDEMAYLGEAGVTSVLRVNACLALRGGYQVMAFHGVSNALETSLSPNGGFDPDSILYHGARFGVEYQR